MPFGKYPVCSGPDLVKALTKAGYALIHQKGSHIKMRKLYGAEKHTIIIPNHKEIDRGTLKSILRKLSKFVPEEEVLSLLGK